MGSVFPLPSGRPTICRRQGCSAPATHDVLALCEAHLAEYLAEAKVIRRRAGKAPQRGEARHSDWSPAAYVLR